MSALVILSIYLSETSVSDYMAQSAELDAEVAVARIQTDALQARSDALNDAIDEIREQTSTLSAEARDAASAEDKEEFKERVAEIRAELEATIVERKELEYSLIEGRIAGANTKAKVELANFYSRRAERALRGSQILSAVGIFLAGVGFFSFGTTEFKDRSTGNFERMPSNSKGTPENRMVIGPKLWIFLRTSDVRCCY